MVRNLKVPRQKTEAASRPPAYLRKLDQMGRKVSARAAALAKKSGGKKRRRK